jgi:hypothetical protein
MKETAQTKQKFMEDLAGQLQERILQIVSRILLF